MGGVGESTFLSSLPAQAYGACYGKTCFSAVRALLFQEQRRRAAKTVFVLKYFSNFPLKYLHILTMEACLVMLLLLVYRMQAVDWGLRLLRLSLLLSLFGCFYNTFIFYHSTLLVRGSHDTLGEAESSTIERLARNASWHQRRLKVE